MLASIGMVLRDHISWLAPILVFGLVIFVHELGHFLAAKAFGVYVPRFSVGFGPTLWRHRWGETEYRVAALPLGGYVRMASRDDEAAGLAEAPSMPGGSDPDAMIPFGPRPIPPQRWFESKPLPARITIMLSGVAMNVVLTLVVALGVLAYYGRPSAHSAPVLDTVVPGSPAAVAGLEPGDRIAAVDGLATPLWSDVVGRIRPAAGRQLVLRVLRHGALLDLPVTPYAVADTNPQTGAVSTVGRIGAGVRLERDPIPLTEAIPDAWSLTWTWAGQIVAALRDLATGRTSLRSVNGPLRIAQVSVEAARSGFEQLLTLVAFLSINVAVFNLLPIPILDGGAIVLTVLESIKGRPFSIRTREYVLRAGLVAIALLFMLVMYNDRCVVSSAFC